MLLKRIIPCLDVDKGRVVKGTNFVDIRDAGDPVELASKYDREGADEVVFLDITASHEKRDNIVELARHCAEELFIPFTIGGGIRGEEDVRQLLGAGADKVSLNSAAIRDPSLITTCARRFGSQCVVIAIDAKRVEAAEGRVALDSASALRWEAYLNGGRVPTGLDAGGRPGGRGDPPHLHGQGRDEGRVRSGVDPGCGGGRQRAGHRQRWCRDARSSGGGDRRGQGRCGSGCVDIPLRRVHHPAGQGAHGGSGHPGPIVAGATGVGSTPFAERCFIFC
jgi:hypothetical protein